MSVVAG